ncbi:hypothetical protein Thermus77412_10990 [Thermus antranikianii]
MISLDTNIILSALDPQDAQHEKAVSLLDELSREVLFISPRFTLNFAPGKGGPS